MVDGLLDRLSVDVPIYSIRGVEVEGDTRRASAYVYSSFIDTLRTGAPPNEAVARSLAGVGADRAAQGIPLGALLQAFRLSTRTAAAEIHSVLADVSAESDAISYVYEALVGWLDIISNLAARDYSAEQARLTNQSEQQRRSFLLGVLYGGIDGDAAIDRAGEVGWDAASDYVVAVAGGPENQDVSEDAVAAIGAAFPLSFMTKIDGDMVILTQCPTATARETFARQLEQLAAVEGLAFGTASPRSGVAGVRRCFLEAGEALAIGRARDLAVVEFDDVILDRLLKRDPDMLATFVDATLGPLLAYDGDRNTELVNTLETWFENGESPTRAAEILHTHPQTVRYRLSRVNELTDAALDSADGRLHLLLALRGRRLIAAT